MAIFNSYVKLPEGMIPMMSAGDKPQGNLSGAHLKTGSDHAENLSKHRFSGYILHG
jgi:hypothetical protein